MWCGVCVILLQGSGSSVVIVPMVGVSFSVVEVLVSDIVSMVAIVGEVVGDDGIGGVEVT